MRKILSIIGLIGLIGLIAQAQKPGYERIGGYVEQIETVRWNNMAVFTNVAGTLTAGNLYYLGNGAWSNANAAAEATSKGLLGVVLGTNAAQGGVLLCGRATNTAWSFTMGDIVYAATNAGALTSTRPTGTNHIVRIVGYAVNTNEVVFNPDRTYIELQ